MKEIRLQNFLHEGYVEAGCDEAGRGPLAGPVFAAAVILPKDFHHPLLNDSKQMTEHSRELLRPIIEREAVAWKVVAVSAAEIDRINILNASIAGMQRAVLQLSPEPEFLLIDGNRFRSFTYIMELSGYSPATQLFGDDDVPPAETQQLPGGPETLLQAAPGKESLFDEPDLFGGWENRAGEAARYDNIPFNCIVKGDGKYAPIAAASVLAKTYRDEYMRDLATAYPEYGWDKNMGYPTAAHIDAIRRHGLTPYHRRTFRVKL